MEDRPGVRFASARPAVALGALALMLAVAALAFCVAAGQSESQLIQTIALLPTVAVGTLLAARRPGNPIGWLLLGASVFFALNAGAVA